MQTDRHHTTSIVRWAARHWLVVAITLLVAAALLAGAPAWAAPTAAPANQTVPRPTPTRDSEPGATATPRGNDDDDAADEGQPGEPAPGQEAPTPVLIFNDNAAVGEALTGVVTVGALNVRSSPNAGARVVGVVRQNELVTVLGRSANGTWWLICCISGTNDSGWVSTQFIQPNFDGTQADGLLPVVDGAAAGNGFPTPTPNPAGPPAPVGLGLDVEQDPPYVWQDKPFVLRFTVNNRGTADAVNVEFSDEFPAGIAIASIEAEAKDAESTVARTPGGGMLVVVTWPLLAAGEQTAVVANLTITDAAAEPVIENLAVVGADNAEALTVGVDIGLPPALPPDFR